MASPRFPSLRAMRLNIWRALICASDQEIRDGMTFYEGAHGLCRFISQALTNGAISTRQVAGIYAVLSPMNGWETNVANTISVIREGCDATVNTTGVNRQKALRVRDGEDPLLVLRGRKVTAFFKAIADPTDFSSVPVDRHLICLALNVKITGNQELRSYAGNRRLYSQIEQAYTELGEREGIGNRLASIAWFVQRRVESGQQLLPHPESPYCCNRPMQSFGKKPRRFYCPTCSELRLVPHSGGGASRFVRPPVAYLDRFAVVQSKDPITGKLGRKRILLGKDHIYANKAGWQYLSRYLVMKETGQRLRPDEHVDHINQDKLDDRLSNFRVVLAESHGQHHTYLAELAGGRGPDGRFTVYSRPIDLTAEVPF